MLDKEYSWQTQGKFAPPSSSWYAVSNKSLWPYLHWMESSEITNGQAGEDSSNSVLDLGVHLPLIHCQFLRSPHMKQSVVGRTIQQKRLSKMDCSTRPWLGTHCPVIPDQSQHSSRTTEPYGMVTVCCRVSNNLPLGRLLFPGVRICPERLTAKR